MLVLKLYLIKICSRNNNFMGFSNKMKNVKNRGFFSLTENNNVIGDSDRPRLIKMANVSPP